jgi:hypothetical protein
VQIVRLLCAKIKQSSVGQGHLTVLLNEYFPAQPQEKSWLLGVIGQNLDHRVTYNVTFSHPGPPGSSINLGPSCNHQLTRSDQDNPGTLREPETVPTGSQVGIIPVVERAQYHKVLRYSGKRPNWKTYSMTSNNISSLS